MKTTIDIPDADLREAIKNTGAKTGHEAILIAVQKFNKRKRAEALSIRLRGSTPHLMTQADLKVMREDDKWKALK